MRMRRLLLALACVLAWSAPASAQVAYQSAVSAGTVASGATITAANVVGSGGNILIICGTAKIDAAQTFNTPTYGGSSTGVTPILDGSNNNRIGALWYLVNPSGTADVVLTTSASVLRLYVTAIVLSGADTSTPIGDSDETTGTADNSSLTLTTAADQFIVDCLTTNGGASFTAGADQTQQGSQSSGGENVHHRASTQDGAAGGVMTYSWTTGSDWYYTAVAVAAGSAASSAPRGTLLGVLP